MSETWEQLVPPISEVEPTERLWHEITARSAADGRHHGGARGWRVLGWGLAAAGGAAVVGLLALAAHTRGTPHTTAPADGSRIVIVDPSRVRVRARIEGGSPGMRQAIRESLAGVGDTSIDRVVVSPAGRKYHPVPPGGVLLTIATTKHGHSHSFDPVDNYANWQAGLVAAAVRDRALERRLEPVVFIFTPDGGDRVATGKLRPQAVDGPGAAQLVRRIRAAAVRGHARLGQLTVLQPRGLAPAVVLDVSDPARFLRDRMSRFIQQAFPAEAGGLDRPTAIDGWYLEVRSSGHVVATQEANQRVGMYGYWTSPPLSGCVPSRGGPGGAAQPPPCPVGRQANTVAPASFASTTGWHTGSSNHSGAPGQQAFTWASTTPFRDGPFAAPPTKTLAAMGPDDLLVEVFLSSEKGGAVPHGPALPFTLDGGASSQDYPGNTGARWFQQVYGTTTGGRVLSVWVFAGRPHPTADQVARAQHLIDGLQFPRWRSPGG